MYYCTICNSACCNVPNNCDEHDHIDDAIAFFAQVLCYMSLEEAIEKYSSKYSSEQIFLYYQAGKILAKELK